jgi:hypothetical protein
MSLTRDPTDTGLQERDALLEEQRAREIRKLEVADGELQELTADAMEALRRQKRAMQGQAQSLEQLVAQGISRPRAVKILQAREAKAALVGEIMDAIEAHRQATGLGVYQAWGVTLGDIKRMKPKELHALQARITAGSAQVFAA